MIRRLLGSWLVVAAVWSPAATAQLPTGPVSVTPGAAAIPRAGAGSLNLPAQRETINWSSFNTTSGSAVVIQQPGNISIGGKVTTPSAVFGKLQSTDRPFNLQSGGVPSQSAASGVNVAGPPRAAPVLPMEFRMEGVKIDPVLIHLPALAGTGMVQGPNGTFQIIAPTVAPALGQ